ncbi:hypothetical protein [Streptomyces sp. HUAS TT20]|nr:hypothetical protein [Streptomyces sp. HUAS 15-9]UXY28437.1 hypothetical protein N8I87_18865 [Streptomyces sp. HUAS 15-9]
MSYAALQSLPRAVLRLHRSALLIRAAFVAGTARPAWTQSVTPAR